jgi:hypothetical protein
MTLIQLSLQLALFYEAYVALSYYLSSEVLPGEASS